MKSVSIAVVAAILLCGCSTFHSHKDSLKITSTSPSPPTVLSIGEKLHITVAYNISSVQKAHIWVRPYTEGRRTANYRAHPSPLYSGSGTMEGWFFFDEMSLVDEIRAEMVPEDSSKAVAETVYKAVIKWQ